MLGSGSSMSALLQSGLAQSCFDLQAAAGGDLPSGQAAQQQRCVPYELLRLRKSI